MNTTDIVKTLRNDCRDRGSNSLCRNGEMNVYCAVGDAADRLEELLDRCARYAEEIAVLRERQKKVEQPGGCAFAPWCDAVREAREKAEGIITNADCIRAMSDELLAEFLDTTQKMECEAFHAINSDGTLRFESLKNGWLEWLQQPAEGVE